ncbi:MAG: putative transposase [Parcubacteria group bacterium Greene0714_4]|nr:MAG: putative transposase [Parcubacteria group bacterium Greene0714_4]
MVDAIYTDYPFYGSRRMRLELSDRYRVTLGREHVQRLMREMGIEAIYPKPKTSTAHPEHKKYPYLLKNLAIVHPNHVWGTDITYIRIEEGWAYLVAFLDWFSRYVIAWELSLSMETDFCITALNQALAIATPEIHNSDQGVQFTDRNYTNILAAKDIVISMDGRGRCMDNIFTNSLKAKLQKEKKWFLPLPIQSGAQERTRTSTPFGISTSRIHVYQFHHLGINIA